MQLTSSQFKKFYTVTGFGFILALCLLTGCNSYQLGSPGEQLPFESIYIKPVANRSFAPQAQVIVSAQLREAFIHDGRVKVVANEQDADAVLAVTLTEYDRSGAARSSVDTALADNFDVLLTASVSLLSQPGNEYFFKDRSVEARTNAYLTNPYAESQIVAYQLSERQAMEQIARQLARDVTDTVLSFW